jgi:AraC-like DNA-binding protein
MEHGRYAPSEDLRPFVAHFWMVRWDLRGEPPFVAETLPHPFQPVLRAPLSRITDRTLALRTVFGPESAALEDAILGEPDVGRCILLAEEFLRMRLPAMPAPIAHLRDVVERLSEDPSMTRVEQVCALAGLELRKLQRRFQDAVGVSPKWVLQRYRLHEAAAQLARADPPDMADLALQLGYFDQSHFARDFKAVVGRSPGAYAAQMGTRR